MYLEESVEGIQHTSAGQRSGHTGRDDVFQADVSDPPLTSRQMLRFRLALGDLEAVLSFEGPRKPLWVLLEDHSHFFLALSS